tara:strand:- start:516 stop:1160 length:645 start_codon:yes stop_codon:yes gene_type:complete
MSTPKKIAWQSWNAKVEEIMASDDSSSFPQEVEPSETDYSEIDIPPELLSPEMFLQQQKILYTPLGAFPEESPMKPSDRWDCWVGHTNFSITNNIADVIEEIEGVEALRILGRYSFFIGVGKLFDIKDVRTAMEKELCVYTEQEILADANTQATVDLVKEQLKTKNYWSMLVSPEGNVEYIVSDTMDRIYLEGLSGLLKLKQDIGGIILRGTNG